MANSPDKQKMDKSTMVTSFSTTIMKDGGESFTKQVETITVLINDCEEDVQLLRNHQNRMIPSDMCEDIQVHDEVMTVMQNLNSQLTLKTETIRYELKGLGSNISQQEKYVQNESSRAYVSLIQSFVDVTKSWNSVQIQITERSKQRLKQHLQKSTATNYGSQEIDKLLELGNISEHVRQFKGSEGHEKAESHCEQITELEKSVADIKLLIEELSTIAKSQGQQTDDLEVDARWAAETCFDAEAARWRIASRNKHCVIFLAVATICVIGGVALYYLFFNEEVEVPHISV